jgi:hypothetical protein
MTVDPRAPAAARRDRLVGSACGWLVVLQTVPYAVVGAATGGAAAAGDGALYALSPAALLGVVGFGVVLAVALTRPGLEPLVDARVPAVTDAVTVTDAVPTSPRQRMGLRRLRWAVAAAGSFAAVYAAAVLLESAARSGASALGDSLDDGSAAWAFVVLALQVLVLDLRAVVAVLVALVVLARARRPVSPRNRRPEGTPARGARPAARTTRWFPDRRSR